VLRGTRTFGPFLAAVLSAVVGLGVVSAGATESPSYRLKVDAVAYHLHGKTASGLPVGRGTVAVDPKLIPLRTRLFVPGYGKAIAADVGIAIKGPIIDLWMPNDEAARKWGRRTLVITVYR
jgi:3D (Asp-Asp-Asp) domain-containing protein